jgi:hypothetical protein
MRFYEATSLIRAEPDRIWAILTDGPDLGPSFETFATGLQRRSEQGA